MKYEIEKDKYLNKWVVWFVVGSGKFDIYHGATKKECTKWVKEIRTN